LFRCDRVCTVCTRLLGFAPSDAIMLTTGFFLISDIACEEDSAGFSHDHSLNSTNIVLIPKKPPATSVSDFRPISLCNVIFKIISKVLAQQVKTGFTFWRSPNTKAPSFQVG
jgi:hypothetical protein